MAIILRLILPLLIVCAGGLAWYGQVSQKVEKKAPPRRIRPATQTAVQELTREDYQVVIRTQGSVQAQNETGITAGVAGRVLSTEAGFETGAFFQKGDVLLRLDDADLRSAVAAAEARLARAESDLLQEESRARQALLNWEDLGYDEEPTDLVLRKPQMRQAEASVKAARADLEQAGRNLERAVVRAPYNGRTRERTVSIGQSIGPSTSLGTVFSTDIAEVRLPLNSLQLGAVTLPEGPDDVPIPLTLEITSPEGLLERDATVVRTEGVLDETTKELFVIAQVDDPFALSSDGPALRIGQPVRARILGEVISDVFVIERRFLRSLDEIIIIEPEELRIQRRTIRSVWSTAESLIVRDGLEAGELMAVSRLTYAPEGGKVEIIEDESAQPKNAALPAGAKRPGA